MSINISKTLTEGLSLLTYNGNKIVTPKDNRLNVYMGIGLWSLRDGLSEGLPVDVMQMLLSAALMRSQIMEEARGRSSKIIILIADSMAIREGADAQKTSQMVQIYKKSLEPLLDLLDIKASSEMVLSSELEGSAGYLESLKAVENSTIIKRLKEEDSVHYAYVRTQTAITRYMNTQGDVGVKVGWICNESSKHLGFRVKAQSLDRWDELKFDLLCEDICAESTMQYLYAKAGLKQSRSDKSINISEGAPYTAYSKDRRYIIQPQGQTNIKSICPIQKRVACQWKGIAELCSKLVQARLAHSSLLPEDCIEKNNAIRTVHNMLNYWANPPLLSPKETEGSLATIISADSPHHLNPFG